MKTSLKRKIRILVLFIFIVMITAFLRYIYVRDIHMLTNVKGIEKWLQSFGKLGSMMFILLQIMQVIVFFIPGEFIQASGGYLYGTVVGTLLSVCGILIGSVITFIIAKKFGDRLLRKILPLKDYNKILSLISKPRNRLIIFVLHLLPGFPKDMLGYVSGITSIKLKEFIIISTIARFPGIVISSYIGSNIYDKNYIIVTFTLIIICIILFVGIKKRDNILKRFE